MIFASWPMPETQTLSTPDDSLTKADIERAIQFLTSKKPDKFIALMHPKEKIEIEKALDDAIKELTQKLMNKSLTVTNFDLDDKGNWKQPSLFDGTKFEPNAKFDSTKFIDLYNSFDFNDSSNLGKVLTAMITITKDELPPQILSGQFNFSSATSEQIAAMFGLPDEGLHSIQLDINHEFPYDCTVIMKRYIPF